jgi:hypothetical protein
MTENKRKFPRAKYPCALTIWQGKSFETIMTKTINVGAGGLLIELDQGMMIGAKAEIKIDFSNEESFRCTGLVLRCQQNRDNEDKTRETYSIAIVFEGLDERKVSYLKGLVDKLLTSEGNQ